MNGSPSWERRLAAEFAENSDQLRPPPTEERLVCFELSSDDLWDVLKRAAGRKNVDLTARELLEQLLIRERQKAQRKAHRNQRKKEAAERGYHPGR